MARSDVFRIETCDKCNWFKPACDIKDSYTACPKCGSFLTMKIGRYQYTSEQAMRVRPVPHNFIEEE